jgi:hypothetical protein
VSLSVRFDGGGGVRTSILVCVDDAVGARIMGIVVASLAARVSSPGTGVISFIMLKGVRIRRF